MRFSSVATSPTSGRPNQAAGIISPNANVMNPSFVKREVCPGCKSSRFIRLMSSSFCEPHIREYLSSFYEKNGGDIDFAYLDGSSFTLNECLGCGLVYQEEIPGDELMVILYEQWIDPQTVFDLDEADHGLEFYGYYAREVMQLVAYFKKSPGQLRFFDFGMGWGKWARMAKAFGCDSYGAEISERRIEHARAHRIEVIGWDEIPEHQFDFINTEQVFEHLPQPLDTLCHLTKALKVGGLLKISVPNGGDIKRRLRVMDWHARKGTRNSLNPVSPLEHINCFCRAAVIRMAARAGLRRVRFPLRLQYAYSTGWTRAKPALKDILRPIYRDILQKGTYLLFSAPPSPSKPPVRS